MGSVTALNLLALVAAPVLPVAVGVTPQEALSASIAVGSARDIDAPAALGSNASLSSAGTPCNVRVPVVGDVVFHPSGEYVERSFGWRLGAGKRAIVVTVDEHGNVELQNPQGKVSHGIYCSQYWTYAKVDQGGAGGAAGAHAGLAPKAASTAKSTSSSGRSCVVPMWDSVTNVCAAGSGKAEAYKDADKIKRTKAADGDLCTVACPGTSTLSRNMIGPSVETMTCVDGTWTDSKTQAAVAAIECATTTPAYFVCMIFFIAVAYMGSNWYNGKPLLEGTPFGGEPAKDAPEVAVVVQTESTSAPEANANAPAQ